MDPYDSLLFGPFPRLQTEGYDHTSPEDPRYNCIAWAADDSKRFWWPTPVAPYFWPDGLSKSDFTFSNFVRAFQSIGYELCDDGNLEDGVEKIVIYSKSGLPSHASRQLEDGRWASKLGPFIDIVHLDANSLEGTQYGRVRQYMCRPRPG